MHSRFRRSGVASAGFVGLLLAIFASGPALADTEKGHRGPVGPHSLRDTMSNPGVRCRYEGGTLTWFDVTWPRVKAISGNAVVGWRFFAQRAAFEPGVERGAFRTTYSSPIETKMTSATRNAAFTTKTVHVTPPSGGGHYLYRILVKMFWYGPDGSRQGTAMHQVDWYRALNPSGRQSTNSTCTAAWRDLR